MKYLLFLLCLFVANVSFAATDTPTNTPTNTPTSNAPVAYANPTLSPAVANSAVDRDKVCDGIAEAKVSSGQISETTALYGITPTPAVAYQPKPVQGFEVVLAIPQSLGGQNVLTNRYPASTTNSYFSEYRRKELINQLKVLMCTNAWMTPLPLATAQSYVKDAGWTRYYKTYVNSAYPTPAVPSATPTPTNTPTPT